MLESPLLACVKRTQPVMASQDTMLLKLIISTVSIATWNYTVGVKGRFLTMKLTNEMKVQVDGIYCLDCCRSPDDSHSVYRLRNQQSLSVYQSRSPSAFRNPALGNGHFEGVSIAQSSPRKHVWDLCSGTKR